MSFQKPGWDTDLGQYLGRTGAVVLETQSCVSIDFMVLDASWCYNDKKPMSKRLRERRKSSHRALFLLNTQSLAVVSYHFFGGLLLPRRQQGLGLQSCTLELMHAKCMWAVLLALWDFWIMWKDEVVEVSLQDQWLNTDAWLANNRGTLRLEESSGGQPAQSSSRSRFSC